MVFKWKEEHTPLFLKHFKKYTCLWNCKTEGYKNRDCRGNAIKSLIEDLNINGVTEDDIKLKIKSIRTRYTCELAKIKRSTKSGCSTDDIYVPKLFWFKQADEFLNAVCVAREGTSNFNIPEQQSQVTEYENTEKSQETPQAADASDSGHSQTSKDEQPLANISHAPRNRKRCSDTPIDKAIKQLKIISDDTKNNTEDEFDLFCRSLAVQLKRMPLHRALICQQKLQEVMVQKRLQFINTSPHDSTRSSSLSHSSYTYVMSPDTYQHEQYPSSISQFQLAPIHTYDHHEVQTPINTQQISEILPTIQENNTSDLLQTAMRNML